MTFRWFVFGQWKSNFPREGALYRFCCDMTTISSCTGAKEQRRGTKEQDHMLHDVHVGSKGTAGLYKLRIPHRRGNHYIDCAIFHEDEFVCC